MKTTRALFLALADTLESFHDKAEELRVSARKALHDAEEPAEDDAVVRKVTLFADAAESIGQAYEALAEHLDREHAGQVTMVNYEVPITAKGLRLEARVAHLMGASWQSEMANVYREVEESLAE